MAIHPSVRGSGSEATLERLERLAWLLDNSIAIPGLRFRIGLDALVGLVPGIGDALGVLVSTYILAAAARLGTPRSVLIRMAFNIAIEGVIGVIPLIGDLFDAAWKANQRNVRLIGAYLSDPRRTTTSSTSFVFVLAALMIGFLVGIGIVGFVVLRWIWHAIGL